MTTGYVKYEAKLNLSGLRHLFWSFSALAVLLLAAIIFVVLYFLAKINVLMLVLVALLLAFTIVAVSLFTMSSKQKPWFKLTHHKIEPMVRTITKTYQLTLGLSDIDCAIYEDLKINAGYLALGNDLTLYISTGALEKLSNTEIEGLICRVLAEVVLSGFYLRKQLLALAKIYSIIPPLKMRLMNAVKNATLLEADIKASLTSRYPPGLISLYEKVSFEGMAKARRAYEAQFVFCEGTQPLASLDERIQILADL